jgi:succinate dehydrogenase/fumarate reductase flavoprotein subunit
MPRATPVGASGWKLQLRRVGSGELLHASVSTVLLATGGFANDKGASSLLREVDPGLLSLRSTNGAFATGDGIKLARACHAAEVDMANVQVHPTGFSRAPLGFEDTPTRSLVLAAEILRGVGGLLLNQRGERFVDELQTRKFVTGVMQGSGEPSFLLAVPGATADRDIAAHVAIYVAKVLLLLVCNCLFF